MQGSLCISAYSRAFDDAFEHTLMRVELHNIIDGTAFDGRYSRVIILV